MILGEGIHLEDIPTNYSIIEWRLISGPEIRDSSGLPGSLGLEPKVARIASPRLASPLHSTQY